MKLTKKRIIMLVMAILAITSFAIFFSFQAKTTVAIGIAYSNKIEEEYVIGDEFIIPEGEIYVGEQKFVCKTPTIEYPDGTENSVKSGAIITLNQSGKYTLRYIVQYNNKAYTQETSFNVAGQIATPSSTNSSTEYREVNELGASSYALVLSIGPNDTITFDHIFDMTEMSSAETMIEGFVLPETQGKADFSKMIFTFTDLEDPSVQLIIHGNFNNDSNSYGLTFFTAAGNGQTQCGLEYYGKLHKADNLGCLVPHSFMAIDTGVYYGHLSPSPMNPDKRLFSITYDYERNQAWAGGKIISDLDDSYYYDTLWTGFPSGKAKLSVSASGISATQATICLTKVLGVDLSVESTKDTQAPNITINTEYTSMPDARVGCNYPIPTATAFDDISGDCQVKTSVWFNYDTDDATMIDVNNNIFTASNVGKYVIVYEATDTSGNVAKKVLLVNSILNQYLPQLKISVSGEQTTADLGELLTLPNIDVTGGSGNISTDVVITNGSNICEVTDNQFRLEEAGEWTVVISAIDYIGDYTSYSYKIQANATNVPIIKNEPNLPCGYISGSKYVLPEIYAYDYSSGSAVKKLCNVRVSYNGQEIGTYKAGSTFIPEVDNNQDLIKIEYILDSYVVFEKEIPVSIVWKTEEIFIIENYFLSTNATLQNQYKLTEDLIGILVETEKEQSKLSFINPQNASNFSIKMATVPGYSKYSTLRLILSDVDNPTLVVTATLEKGDGVCTLEIGGTKIEVAIDLDSNNIQEFTLGLSDGYFVIGSTKINIAKYDNGNKFEGFTSGRIYFDIEIENNEDSKLLIHKLCDNYVSNIEDCTYTSVIVSGNYGGSVLKDGVYTITKAMACDVFAPNTSITVSIMDAKGNILTDVNGTLLNNVDGTKEYQVILNDYGVYTVKYTAKKANWATTGKTIMTYEVRVIDQEAPEITFDGNFQTTAKVGDYIYIPNYTVKDNCSKAENISVLRMITTADGAPIIIDTNKNAIKATSKGTYRIDIVVIDEAGNTTQVVKTVTVS